jgi:putative spermidine/putrescine transport system ATP-binding protein
VLDIALRGISFSYPRSSFALRDINLLVAKNTHTAVIGPRGSGATTLLKLVAGLLPPMHGEVIIGSRVVNNIKAGRRPLLYATSSLDLPDRWSVQHALVAAVRQRTLDRVDRQREYDLALSRWFLGPLVSRSLGTLSSSERTMVLLARIELLRPGIVVADRLLEHLNPADVVPVSDLLHRTFRIMGTTVISAPANFAEQGHTDSVIVLGDGRIVQEGTAAHVYAQPSGEAAAQASGDVSVVPVVIRGSQVESVIGNWTMASAPFQGTGVAIIRPESFSIATRGQESDLIVSVEEASFLNGRWLVTGMLSGSVALRLSLPGDVSVHKGKLMPIRYDPTRFILIQRQMEPLRSGVPVDVVPPMRDSR